MGKGGKGAPKGKKGKPPKGGKKNKKKGGPKSSSQRSATATPSEASLQNYRSDQIPCAPLLPLPYGSLRADALAAGTYRRGASIPAGRNPRPFPFGNMPTGRARELSRLQLGPFPSELNARLTHQHQCRIATQSF